MKAELNGQMVRLREECANRVAELEKQLDSAHGNRMSSMFQMKEEVSFVLKRFDNPLFVTKTKDLYLQPLYNYLIG